MQPRESILALQKIFVHLIDHLIALSKTFTNDELDLKHEIELGILEKHEIQEKKSKGIALKVDSREELGENSLDEDENSMVFVKRLDPFCFPRSHNLLLTAFILVAFIITASPKTSILDSCVHHSLRSSPFTFLNEVPITCDNWRNKQLNEAKDKIWSEIKRCFDIEENRKDHCLKLAGKLLRGFRTFLSTTFLRDTEGTFVDAELPSKYASLISPKEWETFKSKRKTQEFKSVSETNRQRASSPAYPYRKGRVGYGRLEQSILTKENSSETSLPAHVLWKEARVGKDGKIKEDVQQIFEKCETLSQSIVPYEDTDCRSILSRALDVPEYSGRVRGKGFGITQKSLNIKKQKTPSNKELQQTLEALKAEVLELRKERERDRAAGFKDTSDKDSINCNFQPTIPEGISPCHLYLARPTYRMVGKGKVHNNLGELLHTKPLPTGSLKVSVDIALEKDALLPHPDDVSDATLLGDAIGSFVAWPTDLIIVGYETPTKSKAKDKGIAREIESVASQKEIPVAKKTEISKRTGAKKKNPSKYRACLHTYLETTDISDGCVRLIPMDGAIFGFEYAEPLGKEDFDQILYHTQLSIGVINTYMRYLYDKLMGPRGLEQRFSFLNPMKTNLTEMIRKPDEVRTYVVECFMADTDREKLFFLPFNKIEWRYINYHNFDYISDAT
ncbi:uncharacterized protein LOC127103624 [Lathyrus oleraceus]|uniref:uncharacterized protein LOC127103624 n=1 Tax=Pisum sativum TaxID=3888 RepID=UPI0021CF0BF7|nr:uncharacterized protein LOC127103624 [Pisum sativum]